MLYEVWFYEELENLRRPWIFVEEKGRKVNYFKLYKVEWLPSIFTSLILWSCLCAMCMFMWSF